MPDTPSITIVKSFNYRGAREEFSNTYHFTGTAPANAAAWKTMADLVIAAEKLTVRSTIHFDRVYGHLAGVAVADCVIDYNDGVLTRVDGTLTGTGSFPVPGDTAAWIRWPTANFTSAGKRIYLRKYMHGVECDGTLGGDYLWTTQKTALATYAAKWITGTDFSNHAICGPQGAVGLTPLVKDTLTTRTLKRRGKRTPS